MAELNEKQGTIIAHCPGCCGSKSSFSWKDDKGKEFGAILYQIESRTFGGRNCNKTHRLFRCSGCGGGALGVIIFDELSEYPGDNNKLIDFYPQSTNPLELPRKVPDGIKNEFREAEKCFYHKCYRAAAGLFRSVLDKTMRDNGYKNVGSLKDQIDAAADDGVITQARKKKAHDEIRVLGNEVVHDEWHEIDEATVEASRHYCQRILEDLYGDRDTVETILRSKSRIK